MFALWEEAECPQRTHTDTGRTCRLQERPQLADIWQQACFCASLTSVPMTLSPCWSGSALRDTMALMAGNVMLDMAATAPAAHIILQSPNTTQRFYLPNTSRNKLWNMHFSDDKASFRWSCTSCFIWKSKLQQCVNVHFIRMWFLFWF